MGNTVLLYLTTARHNPLKTKKTHSQQVLTESEFKQQVSWQPITSRINTTKVKVPLFFYKTILLRKRLKYKYTKEKDQNQETSEILTGIYLHITRSLALSVLLSLQLHTFKHCSGYVAVRLNFTCGKAFSD